MKKEEIAANKRGNKQPRCPKGMRKNPRTGECLTKEQLTALPNRRCPKGMRKNPRNGECLTKEQLAALPKRRCPKGSRRFRGDCVKVYQV